jgi:hypothetical protein
MTILVLTKGEIAVLSDLLDHTQFLYRKTPRTVDDTKLNKITSIVIKSIIDKIKIQSEIPDTTQRELETMIDCVGYRLEHCPSANYQDELREMLAELKEAQKT